MVRNRGRMCIVTLLLSMLFAFFMIFGRSFALSDSWNLVLETRESVRKGIIGFGAYTIIFFVSMYILLYFVGWIEIMEEKKHRAFFPYSLRGFLLCWAAVFVLWLPYLTAFYPGIANSDVADQLAQVFNFNHGIYQFVDFPIEGSYRNGHHPYFNTIIHGIWFKVGMLLSSQNLGIFLHGLVQTLFTSAIFAYIIVWMEKWRISWVFRVIAFIVFVFIPCFPLYAMNQTKNTIYTNWLLIYAILLAHLVFDTGEFMKKKWMSALFMLSVLLQMLHMKYGIHIVLISIVPVAIMYRKYWKRWCVLYLVPIFLYSVVFNAVLLPMWKVAPGSEREKYSIPFQQTARYVKEYGAEVTPEERAAIDEVLVYDSLAALYIPQTSDGVKFYGYRSDHTEEEMKAYLKVWFQMLWKHPGIYVEAAINECFGFFYPGFWDWTNYYGFSENVNTYGDGFFHIYHPQELAGLKAGITEWAESFRNMPVLKMFYRAGSYTWVLFWTAAILIILKKGKYLIPLLPLLGTVLVCIVSPYNANTRYLLPVIFGISFAAGIALKAVHEDVMQNREERVKRLMLNEALKRFNGLDDARREK